MDEGHDLLGRDEKEDNMADDDLLEGMPPLQTWVKPAGRGPSPVSSTQAKRTSSPHQLASISSMSPVGSGVRSTVCPIPVSCSEAMPSTWNVRTAATDVAGGVRPAAIQQVHSAGLVIRPSGSGNVTSASAPRAAAAAGTGTPVMPSSSSAVPQTQRNLLSAYSVEQQKRRLHEQDELVATPYDRDTAASSSSCTIPSSPVCSQTPRSESPQAVAKPHFSPESVNEASKKAPTSMPRWMLIHKDAGPCARCSMCLKAIAYGPRLYTHPQQWSSAQLQALAVKRGVSGSQCVCRNCLLLLMGQVHASSQSAATAAGGGGGDAGGDRGGAGSTVVDAMQAPLSMRPGSTVGAATSSKPVNANSGSRHLGAAAAGGSGSMKRGRRTPAVSDTDSANSSQLSSSEADDSEDDQTFRVGKSKRKQHGGGAGGGTGGTAAAAVKQVACAYPKCPEPARHHIGQRSHPAAATLLSLSWDVIKASCDSSGRLPLCNEHHKTINQLHGPSAKGYQTKSSIRDLVDEKFRPEDYGPALRNVSANSSSTSASKSCATGTSGRKGRKWRAIDTNTPFARALRTLPKAVERPDRTYCGLVRMPVTCLLPASHDMALDRDMPHVPPKPLPKPAASSDGVSSTVASSNISTPHAVPSSNGVAAGSMIPPVQRFHTHRLFGCVPIDVATGESVPKVQLLYADRPRTVVVVSTTAAAATGTTSTSNTAAATLSALSASQSMSRAAHSTASAGGRKAAVPVSAPVSHPQQHAQMRPGRQQQQFYHQKQQSSASGSHHATSAAAAAQRSSSSSILHSHHAMPVAGQRHQTHVALHRQAQAPQQQQQLAPRMPAATASTAMRPLLSSTGNVAAGYSQQRAGLHRPALLQQQHQGPHHRHQQLQQQQSPRGHKQQQQPQQHGPMAHHGVTPSVPSLPARGHHAHSSAVPESATAQRFHHRQSATTSQARHSQSPHRSAAATAAVKPSEAEVMTLVPVVVVVLLLLLLQNLVKLCGDDGASGGGDAAAATRWRQRWQ
eukprot:scpid59876/ scgid12380/ 